MRAAIRKINGRRIHLFLQSKGVGVVHHENILHHDLVGIQCAKCGCQVGGGAWISFDIFDIEKQTHKICQILFGNFHIVSF